MEPCFGILMWFCLALGLFGLAVMAIGILVQVIYLAGDGILHINFFAAPSLLIFAGIVIFAIAFLGCFGAAKKNYALLMIFGTLMLLMFVFVFAGSIACYYNRAHLEGELENEFNVTMMKYPHVEQIRKSWDIMQHDLQCCGINGPSDWEFVYHNESIPNSCCNGAPLDEASNQFTCKKSDANAFQVGCMNLMLDSLKSRATIIGTVAILVAFVQIIIVIFSCYLAGTVRSEYQTV